MKNIKFVSIHIVSILLMVSNILVAQKTHVVKQGETLYSLSKTYGIPVAEIAKMLDDELSA